MQSFSGLTSPNKNKLSRRGFIIGVVPVTLTGCAVPPAVATTIAVISFVADVIQVTQLLSQALNKSENADLPAAVRKAPENSVIYSNAQPPQIGVRISNPTSATVRVPQLDINLYANGSAGPLESVRYPGIIEMDAGVNDVLPDKVSFSYLTNAASDFMGRIDALQRAVDFNISPLELRAIDHSFYDRVKALQG